VPKLRERATADADGDADEAGAETGSLPKGVVEIIDQETGAKTYFNQELGYEVYGPNPQQKGKGKGFAEGNTLSPAISPHERRIQGKQQTAARLLEEMANAINRPDILAAAAGKEWVTPAQKGLAVLAKKLEMGDLRTWKFVMEYMVGTPVQRSVSYSAHADLSATTWLEQLRNVAISDADTEMADLGGETGDVDEVGG
jgi:hypothetical protein